MPPSSLSLEVGARRGVFQWVSYGASPLLRSFAVIPQTGRRTGRFHRTITQQLFSYSTTSRRSLAAPQTPAFPTAPRTLRLPPGPPGISESNKDAEIQTAGFGWRTWNVYFSLLLGAPILFWKNPSENTDFASLWGARRAKG